MSHSRKILAQAGFSLADVYDIVGSVIGLEELDVTEVKAVHELGGQIHSERLQSFILQQTTGALAQNVVWDLSQNAFPDSVNRLLGLIVVSNVAARVRLAQVSVSDNDTGREIPVYVFDNLDDDELSIRWSNDGAAAATHFFLRPTAGIYVPNLLTRLGTTKAMPNITFRGTTDAFGAGTVTTTLIMHIARPNTAVPGAGEPSSHGLPIPSW
jgi:hypothetical protein